MGKKISFFQDNSRWDSAFISRKKIPSHEKNSGTLRKTHRALIIEATPLDPQYLPMGGCHRHVIQNTLLHVIHYLYRKLLPDLHET